LSRSWILRGVSSWLECRRLEEYGCELLEATCQHDLEGIVVKRKADPYSPETACYKIKNPTYTQGEGRRELFERRAP
jgi:ATP-dependent DNA ligase